MRLAEISSVLDVLKRVNDGEGAAVSRENRRASSTGAADLSSWTGRIDLKREVTMAGHSFGGATTVRLFSALGSDLADLAFSSSKSFDAAQPSSSSAASLSTPGSTLFLSSTTLLPHSTPALPSPTAKGPTSQSPSSSSTARPSRSGLPTTNPFATSSKASRTMPKPGSSLSVRSSLSPHRLN